jgi:outer membrane biosynthesis protein TonB
MPHEIAARLAGSTSLGAAADVVVLETSHPGFERAAVEAVYEFKYKPMVIDGHAVDAPGTDYRFSFELEN